MYQIASRFGVSLIMLLLSTSMGLAAPRGPDTEAELQAKEEFITSNPALTDSLKLRVDLGHAYRQDGRFSRSLHHWDEAWSALKGVGEGPMKLTADAALVHRAHLMASLGRLEELKVLMKEQSKRSISDDYLSMMWGQTKEAVYHMNRRPEISYKCGVYALNNPPFLS